MRLEKIKIVCEGENDRIFLHETVTNKLNTNPVRVKTYARIATLIRDIRNNKQKDISISEGGGFPRCIKIAVRLSRQFWYIREKLSIGVVADSNKGRVYNRLHKYLYDYLRTPCKKHNVNPRIRQFDSEQRLTISFKREKAITMWTLLVPKSLETQISHVLKRKYPKLKSIDNDDEIIKAAANLLGTTREDIIRRSVKWFKNKKWFNDFCARLDGILTE